MQAVIGIYRITNIESGKFYIGSSINITKRWSQHKGDLRRGVHKNPVLQSSWNYHGEDAFSFEVLAKCKDSDVMFKCEQAFIDANYDDPLCMNLSKCAEPTPMLGRNHTEETKQRLREATARAHAEGRGIYKGRKHSPEHVEAIRQANMGCSGPKGHIRSEEHRRKLSEANKGNQNWLGKRHTEESVEKMGVTAFAVSPDGHETRYPSINAMRKALGITGMPTVLRAIRSGDPLSFGPHAGWMFYTEKEDNRTVVPPEYAHLPRSRKEAKETGAKMYFTGKPCDRGHIVPRTTKGECLECRKLQWEKDKEKRRQKKLATA